MKRIALLAIVVLAGCRGQTSRDAPIVGIRNMYDQPRYDLQSESDFFPDHRTMRPLVDGVVAQETETDPAIASGRLEDETGYVLEIPKEVVMRSGGWEPLVARGKARYTIYCTPCHDATGSGQGMVRKRALATGAAAFAPASFHQDRLRHEPDGQLFATITNGKSNMPPYGMQIPVSDRWAIVAYVRALQVAHPELPTEAAAQPAPPGGASATPSSTSQPAPPSAPPKEGH
jgi:mono/diheme cytochrome c family protein